MFTWPELRDEKVLAVDRLLKLTILDRIHLVQWCAYYPHHAAARVDRGGERRSVDALGESARHDHPCCCKFARKPARALPTLVAYFACANNRDAGRPQKLDVTSEKN